MTNNEMNPYYRLPLPEKKESLFARLSHVDVYELAEYVLSFLLNRILLFGALSPFGLAYFSASFPAQKKVYGIVAACLGVLLGGFGLVSLKYVGSIVIVAAFSLLMNKELSKHKWLYGLIASLALVANGLIYVLFNGFLLYDCMMLLLEGLITFFSFFAFDRAIQLIRGLGKRRVFESSEIISLVLLSGAALCSISAIPHMEGAAHVLSISIIMVLSLTCGFSVSTAAGVVLGLVASVGDVLPAQVIGVYALSAFASGLLRRYGKWGVAAGFLVTNAASMIYLNSSANTILTYYYIMIAAVLLFLLPDSILSRFGQVAQTPGLPARNNPSERAREILTDKLTESSESFDELSGIFKELIEDRINTDIKDVNLVFDKTADKVCKTCSMCKFCWNKNYNDTVDMLHKMFPFMQERGYAADIDAPHRFREQCVNLDEFLSILNKNYEVYKVNLMWSGKVLESRNLVAEQFRNISSILNNIKKQLNTDYEQDIALEKKIMAALDRKGISVDNVSVSGADGFEVTMDKPSCGSTLVCSTTMASVVSEVLGVPMLRAGRQCSDTVCHLTFREQTRFAVDAGIAKIARERETQSGDNHTFQPLADGKYILALSDGMGSGSRANVQSGITIELIKRLMNAGFDKETAIRLINSVLMVNTDRETFATVDMCLVNLYSGALEFIKIGAATSFVKSGGEVSPVRCCSLPAGVVEHIEADCELQYAKSGDFVVLVTDGITDILESGESPSLSDIIAEFHGTSAQALADTILKEAIKHSGGMVHDDMTVLAARISEEM